MFECVKVSKTYVDLVVEQKNQRQAYNRTVNSRINSDSVKDILNVSLKYTVHSTHAKFAQFQMIYKM